MKTRVVPSQTGNDGYQFYKKKIPDLVIFLFDYQIQLFFLENPKQKNRQACRSTELHRSRADLFLREKGGGEGGGLIIFFVFNHCPLFRTFVWLPSPELKPKIKVCRATKSESPAYFLKCFSVALDGLERTSDPIPLR